MYVCMYVKTIGLLLDRQERKKLVDRYNFNKVFEK
jgi:hypothetical protein